MGVLDKIKNALFEVEYVEVDEPPVKEKKSRFRDKFKEKKSDDEKPVAKKIVLPGKKEDKVEEIHEEELKSDNYETRPLDETPKEEKHDSFKMLDDNDFVVDSDYDKVESTPVPQPVFETPEPKRMRREDIMSSKYEEVSPAVEEKKVEQYSSRPVENSYSSTHESKPYGVDNSYNVPVHEYGTYEKKEEKTYFKPSPIISPIYGILDKNYKKEDVVQKKEIRLSTNYSRGNVSVDDVRNKAYGERKKREDSVSEQPVEETKFEVDEEDDDNLLVDLSDKAKPEVKELTMGDALEYFQDLGLEYNVDYVDVSNKKASQQPQAKHAEKSDENIIENSDIKTEENVVEKLEEKQEVIEKPIIHTHVDAALEDDIQDVIEDNYEKPKLTSSIEVKDESTSTSEALDDDDNLFDLIDSMYQEKE